jgi:hypothetical protein
VFRAPAADDRDMAPDELERRVTALEEQLKAQGDVLRALAEAVDRLLADAAPRELAS